MARHDIEKMWENLLKEDTGSRVQIIQEIHEFLTRSVGILSQLCGCCRRMWIRGPKRLWPLSEL